MTQVAEREKTYVERTLVKGERIKFQGRVHPGFCLSMGPLVLMLEVVLYFVFVYNFTRQGVSPGLLPWILLPLPLLLFIQPWLVVKTSELAITNQRVLIKTGAFSQSTAELGINQIESVEVDQPFLGRIFGYGTVLVRGTGGGCTPAPGIIDPIKFRKILMEECQATQNLERHRQAPATRFEV